MIDKLGKNEHPKLENELGEKLFISKSNWVWCVCFDSVKLEPKSLNIVFCLEMGTQEIKAWATGFNIVTTQNLIRKLKEAITKKNSKESEAQIILHLKAESSNFIVSKAYKKFANDYSDSILTDTKKIEYQNKIDNFLKTFADFQRSGKTLSQEIIDSSKNVSKITAKSAGHIIAKYIENWNNTKIFPFVPESIFVISENNSTLSESEVERTRKKLLNVRSLPTCELTYDEKEKIDYWTRRFNDLEDIVKKAQDDNSLKEVVCQLLGKVSEGLDGISTIKYGVSAVNEKVDRLLPNEKRKSTPVALRDPIPKKTFHLLMCNAGSKASYQKRIRESQLKIAYTLLFHLGLRLNEIRTIKLKTILEAMRTSELKVTLFKTNRSHNYKFSESLVEDLKALQFELDFLGGKQDFEYLFGKKSPPHSKTLLRIVNEDLAATCEIFQIPDNIKSHSFRIGLISRLLKNTKVQDVALIMGHADLRSTMKYSRYRLSKSEIQEIYKRAEETDTEEKQ